MQLNKHNNSLTTNGQFSSQNFGIGDASVVIEILRNRLYKFKIRTLVQEYISNARDATREAKGERPIEIILPTRLEPVFKVRDFGVGITPERMETVFVLYGASTKRNTNGQTGGFGIGAKSAWSYTDSFTITTITDGEKRTYIAHTGVNNQGRLDYIGSEPTDAPNGTEIQVPVNINDIAEFKNSAFRATYFWNKSERPIYKNISAEKTTEEPFPSNESLGMIGALERLGGRILPKYIDWDFNSWKENKNPIAVIDGIVYPLEELSDKIPSLKKLQESIKSKVILHLGNGVVEVSAAREGIADSETTINSLEKIAADTLELVSNYVQKHFDDVKSLLEFVDVWKNVSTDFWLTHLNPNYKGFTTDGKNIYHKTLFHMTKKTMMTYMSKRYYGPKTSTMRKESENGNYISLNYLTKGTVFWELPFENKIQNNKRYQKFLSTTGADYMITLQPLPKKLSQFKELIDVLKPGKTRNLPFDPNFRVEAPAKRDNDKVRLFIHKHGGRFTRDVRLSFATERYIYMDEKQLFNISRKNSISEIGGWMLANGGNYLVSMPKGNLKRIKNHPQFINIDEFMKTFKLSDKQIKQAKMKSSKNREFLRYISKSNFADKIKDPFIKEMINEYDDNMGSEIPKFFMTKEMKSIIDKFITKDVALKKYIKYRFPLLQLIPIDNIKSRGKLNRQKVIDYLNKEF